jgi:hypothetical protein
MPRKIITPSARRVCGGPLALIGIWQGEFPTVGDGTLRGFDDVISGAKTYHLPIKAVFPRPSLLTRHDHLFQLLALCLGELLVLCKSFGGTGRILRSLK